MKNDAIGSFCLVLHGHLPYVLHHGVWPHGEDWLYEAAAETYLPILAIVDECLFFNARPKITMGLTPVLLEQLAHEDFKAGFITYLVDRIKRAQEDRADFERMNDGHLAHLATRWETWFKERLEQFEKLKRDIPAAYAERAKAGHFEILTSCATHGYMPLLGEDASIRAQIRAGVATSERILGFKPTGMWMPECAYRPGGAWQSPVNWGGTPYRIGVEHLAADEGITHFFTENHLIEGSRSEWVINDGQHQKVGWDEATKYPARGWRSVHEPHGVNSDGNGPARVTAFARDPKICEKVWSGTIGYPADGTYLEFHKKWGERRGLRYWKITGKNVNLGDKHSYYPDDVDGKVHAHAQHFCDEVRSRLWEHRNKTGRHGVVTACFDAELFGHWWFEGPKFIRDVMLSLNADPHVELNTTEEITQKYPADKVVAMPEGSWGEEGDHRVWMNDQTRWIWEVEYRAEALFGRLTFQLPWRQEKATELRKMLERAGRELLLMQASDWPFVISRGQAIDYGIKRFVLHAGRFETMAALAEKIARGEPLTSLEEFEVKDADLHDPVFKHIDLNWWNM
ncbi:MAG: 1,4-alpha-glucan branching protein domain-containing protein [Phycisphaeraceae bacterium]